MFLEVASAIGWYFTACIFCCSAPEVQHDASRRRTPAAGPGSGRQIARGIRSAAGTVGAACCDALVVGYCADQLRSLLHMQQMRCERQIAPPGMRMQPLPGRNGGSATGQFSHSGSQLLCNPERQPEPGVMTAIMEANHRDLC